MNRNMEIRRKKNPTIFRVRSSRASFLKFTFSSFSGFNLSGLDFDGLSDRFLEFLFSLLAMFAKIIRRNWRSRRVFPHRISSDYWIIRKKRKYPESSIRVTKKNGLQNITRRMKSFGGTFKIINEKGTITILELPLWSWPTGNAGKKENPAQNKK